MFATEISRSGELTLFIKGKAVHSIYDPEAEADTFLKKKIFKKTPQIFLLIGPGLGYLKISVIKFYPNAHILSLHLDNWIFEKAKKNGDNWVYNEKTDLGSKLSHTIPDFLLSETTIIKWLPCTRNFPDRTKDIEDRIQQFFLERKGTIFTTSYFGRKWIRNTYYNFLKENKLVKINSIDLPIVIAASGPSLRQSIDIIQNYRDKFILAALPSSLSALNEADIRPDFIFHTDPGFWANEHLKYILETDIPIIMPLTSSFNPNIENPVIYINQGSFLENLLLKNSFLKIPSHGTVAGTAYLFLRKITDNPIIFLGLDFCYNDIMEHVTPHSFDIIYNLDQNRFNGYLNILYEKLQYSTSNALTTYSGWFDNKSKLSNAYRYNATNISTNGLIQIDKKQLEKLLDINTQTGKSILFIKETDVIFNKSTLTNVLKHIILLLDNFKSDISTMTSNKIFNFFIKSNQLTELFQYTAYSDILKLTHCYRNNPDESRKLLDKIYSETKVFIITLMNRSEYE